MAKLIKFALLGAGVGAGYAAVQGYRQDEPLQWGFLTRPEVSARHRQAAAQAAKDDATKKPEQE